MISRTDQRPGKPVAYDPDLHASACRRLGRRLAGARVRVWLNGSDEPADPPPGQSGLVFGAVALAFGVSCGAGLVLAMCYGLARLVLDRRRLAAWDSDWALTGPRWTTRQG